MDPVNGLPIPGLIFPIPDIAAVCRAVSIQVQVIQPLHLPAMSLDMVTIGVQPFCHLNAASQGSAVSLFCAGKAVVGLVTARHFHSVPSHRYIRYPNIVIKPFSHIAGTRTTTNHCLYIRHLT